MKENSPTLTQQESLHPMMAIDHDGSFSSAVGSCDESQHFAVSPMPIVRQSLMMPMTDGRFEYWMGGAFSPAAIHQLQQQQQQQLLLAQQQRLMELRMNSVYGYGAPAQMIDTQFCTPQFFSPQVACYPTQHASPHLAVGVATAAMSTPIAATAVGEDGIAEPALAAELSPAEKYGPGPPIVTGDRVKGPRGCNLFVFHLPNEITNW